MEKLNLETCEVYSSIEISIYKKYAEIASTRVLDLILEENFDMIIELKEALKNCPEMIQYVGKQLKEQISKRLLLPGVITHQILP